MRDAQKPDHINLSQLISRLREGRYVIPDFQREFEWKPSDIRDLLRSIFHHLGKDDPKIRFHATIKEIEQRLGDQSVTLDSFIVSNTPAVTMEMQWSMDRAELRQRNIVFQQDPSSYIDEILRAATTA
jgi:hypothetical protein